MKVTLLYFFFSSKIMGRLRLSVFVVLPDQTSKLPRRSPSLPEKSTKIETTSTLTFVSRY